MSKKSLTVEDIKTLVNLNNKYKEAKDRLDEAKARLVPDSVDFAKYFQEGVGSVNKVHASTTFIDYKRMLDDHPEIDIDDYTEERDSTRIYISNYKDDECKNLLQKVLRI